MVWFRSRKPVEPLAVGDRIDVQRGVDAMGKPDWQVARVMFGTTDLTAQPDRRPFKQLPDWAKNIAINVVYELDHVTEPSILDIGTIRWSPFPKEDLWKPTPDELEMPIGPRICGALDDIWLLCWLARAKMLAKIINWDSPADVAAMSEKERFEHEAFLPTMLSAWQDADFDPFEKNFAQLLSTFKVDVSMGTEFRPFNFWATVKQGEESHPGTAVGTLWRMLRGCCSFQSGEMSDITVDGGPKKKKDNATMAMSAILFCAYAKACGVRCRLIVKVPTQSDEQMKTPDQLNNIIDDPFQGNCWPFSGEKPEALGELTLGLWPEVFNSGSKKWLEEFSSCFIVGKLIWRLEMLWENYGG